MTPSVIASNQSARIARMASHPTILPVRCVIPKPTSDLIHLSSNPADKPRPATIHGTPADEETVPCRKERAVTAPQKLVAAKGTPSNASTPRWEQSRDSLPAPASKPRVASPLLAPTPPSSPKQAPVDHVEDLVQTAIHQAEALPLCEGLWNQTFGSRPKEQLMSTLEKIRTTVAESMAMCAPSAASCTTDAPVKCGDIDHLDNAAPKLDRGPSLGHEQPPDFERLIKALERFVPADAPTPPSSSASEAGESEADNGKNNMQAEQASKLEYKRVTEAYVRDPQTLSEADIRSWDDKAGAYKIMKSDAKPDELDAYLFVVRLRTGKSSYTGSPTRLIDFR